MIAAAIAFDVYGTLVDPLAMRAPLAPLAGDRADQLAALWRRKQIEYAFRRALMRRYEPFAVCTLDALRFAAATLGILLDAAGESRLLDAYGRLPLFPDVAASLHSLRSAGATLVAFSNGAEAAVRALLDHAGIAHLLDDVISVDDLRTFKPDPAVYLYLAQRLARPPGQVWLVSANGWDVIGAAACGLRTAWLARDPDALYDPWGGRPDLVLGSLTDLAGRLPPG